MADLNSKTYHFDNNYIENPILFENVLLYQIGELYSKSNMVVEAHWQNCYEITFVISGKGQIVTNGIASEIVKNDLYLSFPDDMHKIISDNEQPLRYFFIGFDTKDDKEIVEILKSLKKYNFNENKRIVKNININEIISKCLSEIAYPSAYSDHIIGLYLKEIIILMYRGFLNQIPKFYAPVISNYTTLIFNVKNYIDENILSLTKLKDLTNVFNYNYSYISRCFSSITGESLNDYFQRKKMEKAKQMIEKNTLTITSIAEALHFSSIHTFSRSFKKYNKMSPLKYKELILTKNKFQTKMTIKL